MPAPYATCSVDGHALQIDELRGTKPAEKIDLSGKMLGVTSAIIIAACIKENGVLKELKCAASLRPSPQSCQCPLTCLEPCACSLTRNEIRAKGGEALAAVLPQTKITSLECAAAFTPQPSVNAH